MILFFDRLSHAMMFSEINFSTYEWVLLGIILLSAIIGLVKGFAKQLFALCGFLTVLIVSILLCKVVARLLPDESGLIFNRINDWLNGEVAKGSNELALIWNTPANWSDAETVKGALSAFGLPKILSFLVAPLTKKLPDGAVLAETLPTALTQIANNVICCIVLFILLSIVVFILKRVFSKIIGKIHVLKIVDKVLGLVLGAGLGVFWVSVLFSAINLGRTVIDVAFITSFFDEKIFTTQTGSFILKISDWLLGLIGK